MDKLLRNKKAIIVFMAPGLLLFTLILFVPICQSIYYSLCEYKATSITGPKFIGLKNYADLLKDDTFWIALKNSFFFNSIAFSVTIFNPSSIDVVSVLCSSMLSPFI